MAYTKIEWDEATALSPTNLNLMDDGIFAASAKLGEVVLTDVASSVTFSSIPAGFKNLQVVVYGQHEGTGFVSLNLRFNGSSAAGAYDSLRRWSTVAAGTTFDFGSFTVLRVGVVNASSRSAVGILIPRYSEGGRRKVAYGSGFVAGATDATAALTDGGGRWVASTDAVTSVLLSPSGEDWSAGSEFYLYGWR